MACTTVLVGKDASYDGSTLVARNHDAPSGVFEPQKFVVVQKKEQPKKYKSILSHVEIDLNDEPMRYTSMPNALPHDGIWGGCGVNELNISMTATETLTSNERVLGADPLIEYDKKTNTPGGIGEEDILTLVLPYIKSAREGVIRLGSILKNFGTYEMNGIAFQDENEIWWLETIGGHHWIAKRVPDNSYVVMPNQQGIDEFDLEDALGKQVNHMCSEDMKEFIEKNHLDLSLDGHFNARYAFGSNSDADHTYNTPRAWIIQRYFNPRTNTWDGIDAEFRPEDDDLPWARVPERKITVEDIKYVLSHHFQGTPYDPYLKYGDDSLKGKFRPIGVNRNNFLGLVQIRPYMPEAIKSLEWISFGSNVFNALVPYYVNINKTPEYMSNTTGKISTDNYYWANRLIAALADPHFNDCSSHIERYQLSVQSKARAIIHDADNTFKEGINVEEFCEQVNDKMAEMLKVETDDVLDKVLYTASSNMKNHYARSDA